MPAELMIALNPKFEKTIAAALEPGEEVLVKLSGAFKEALVCTDRRVMIVKMGWGTGNIFGSNVFQLLYEQLSSVEVKFGMLTGYFEMSAGGMQNTMKSYWSQEKVHSPQASPNCVSLNRALADKFREAVKFIMARKAERIARPAPAAASLPAAEDPVAMIEKLAGLRDRGVLTEDEFAMKKAEIMARI